MDSQLLKYPDIINKHTLRKLGCRIWRAGPVSPNGDIEYKEKIAVEWPTPSGLNILTIGRHIGLVVHQDLNTILLPYQAENMKQVREIASRKAKTIAI